jgi:hypothetical protein
MSEKEYDRTATMDKCWRCGSTGNCCGRQDNPSLLALLAEKDEEILVANDRLNDAVKICEGYAVNVKQAEQKVTELQTRLSGRTYFQCMDKFWPKINEAPAEKLQPGEHDPRD